MKKFNIIKTVFVLLMVTFSFTLKAQQDPMYTQYMFNTQVINPAYAGTWESLSFMVLARQQWAGFDGAPQTYTFSAQIPLKNERTALGLDLISDKIGLEKRFYMFVDYSHLVQITEKTKLRLGLKGGLTNYSNNLMDYNLTDYNDPLFQDHLSKTTPNFGVGAFLYDSERYYVGLSIPRILNHNLETDSNVKFSPELRHYFFIAGLVFNLGENLKFKPTMLTKAAFGPNYGTPLQLDLSANFLIKEKIWLGAMYRTGDSYGFIAQWIFDKKLRIGYAYDITTTNLRQYNNGSHELMLSYELRFLKEIVTSPRYF